MMIRTRSAVLRLSVDLQTLTVTDVTQGLAMADDGTFPDVDHRSLTSAVVFPSTRSMTGPAMPMFVSIVRIST